MFINPAIYCIKFMFHNNFNLPSGYGLKNCIKFGVHIHSELLQGEIEHLQLNKIYALYPLFLHLQFRLLFQVHSSMLLYQQLKNDSG